MQHIAQKLSFRSEVTQTYLDAIRTSLDHFMAIENQLDRQAVINEMPLPDFVDRENYLAISALEKVGVTNPKQEQIDVIETLIWLASHIEHLTPEKFDICTGADAVARNAYLRCLTKKNTGS